MKQNDVKNVIGRAMQTKHSKIYKEVSDSRQWNPCLKYFSRHFKRADLSTADHELLSESSNGFGVFRVRGETKYIRFRCNKDMVVRASDKIEGSEHASRCNFWETVRHCSIHPRSKEFLVLNRLVRILYRSIGKPLKVINMNKAITRQSAKMWLFVIRQPQLPFREKNKRRIKSAIPPVFWSRQTKYHRRF